ncbi:hypothetical protein, partial [Stenotrophomonas hibiscicola]|uniref:hypothetical protein n=1 Tax=Stenotrophomonas hibiscicola TaxID=86189 RepID=UPI003208D238
AMLRKRSALTHGGSRHPWRSRPRNRTHPAFDSFLPSVGNGVLLWWVSTLVDTVDPRHAWILFDQLSKYSIPMDLIHAKRG